MLDSYNNPTYADGQAGAIYGQWPPLVNPVASPASGTLMTSLFEAPKFEGEKLAEARVVTVFFNGVMVHHRKELNGSTEHRVLGAYKPHGDEPLLLQDHGNPVRYRNLWVRPLTLLCTSPNK